MRSAKLVRRARRDFAAFLPAATTLTFLGKRDDTGALESLITDRKHAISHCAPSL